MGRVSLIVVLVALAALAAAPLSAQSADTETVRLYTNADLVPLEAPSAPPAAEPVNETGWQFVVEFISREHERLEAERTHALEQRVIALEEDRLTHAPRFRGYYGFPYYDSRHQDRGQKLRRDRRAPAARRQGIVPLHARPSNAQIQRANAMRYSGRDAVPQRSGR